MEKSIWFSFPFVCPCQTLPLFLFLPLFVRTFLCDVSFFMHFLQVMFLCLSLSSALLLLSLSFVFQLSKPSNNLILACIALIVRSSLCSWSMIHLQLILVHSTLDDFVPSCCFGSQVQQDVGHDHIKCFWFCVQKHTCTNFR